MSTYYAFSPMATPAYLLLMSMRCLFVTFRLSASLFSSEY